MKKTSDKDKGNLSEKYTLAITPEQRARKEGLPPRAFLIKGKRVSLGARLREALDKILDELEEGELKKYWHAGKRSSRGLLMQAQKQGFSTV
jgi:hypothetical protein